MLDGFDPRSGASADPRDRLKGELFATFSEMKASHGIGSSDLAWLTISVLLKHIEKHDGLEALIEFSGQAGAHLTENATGLIKIIEEDYLTRQVN